MHAGGAAVLAGCACWVYMLAMCGVNHAHAGAKHLRCVVLTMHACWGCVVLTMCACWGCVVITGCESWDVWC